MATLLVVTRLSDAPGAAAAAARALEQPSGWLASRLAGSLPRAVLLEPDAERARAQAAALRELGYGIVTCDPRAAPSDDERLVARTLVFAGDTLTAMDAAGDSEDVPATGVRLVQRGVRVAQRVETTTESKRRLALGRALLSGGLILTKKVEIKSTRTFATPDAFLLLQRDDGGRDVMLYESRVDYRCLGGALQPSRTANFQALVERVRGFVPRAPFDTAAGAPGFAEGFRMSGGDPVDVGVMVVFAAHLSGQAGRR